MQELCKLNFTSKRLNKKGISFLFLFLLLSTLALALPEPIKQDASHWLNTKHSGIQAEYFDIEEENLGNGKMKICLLPLVDTTTKDSWYEDNVVKYSKNGELKGQIEPSDFEVEKEGGKVKKACVDLDNSLSNYYHIGSNSIIYEWINQTWLIYATDHYDPQGTNFHIEFWENESKLEFDDIYFYAIEDTNKFWVNVTHDLINPKIRIWNTEDNLHFDTNDGIVKQNKQCLAKTRDLETGKLDCLQWGGYELNINDN